MMAEIEKGYFPDKATQLAIKNTVDSIKTTTDTTKTGVDSLNTKQDSLLQKINSGGISAFKQVDVFDKPGTYKWTCPPGVKYVRLTMFGGGASGGAVKSIETGNPHHIYGGGGGTYVNGKYIPVVAGTIYDLVVGPGGQGVAPPATAGLLNPGLSGGATSAFGISCPGGLYTVSNYNPQYTASNHPLVNNSSQVPNPVYSAELDYGPIMCTPFGISGRKTTVTYGPIQFNLGPGGAGYGDGGHGNDLGPLRKMSPGCGSGATVNKNSQNGGDGIIIIEY